MKRRAFLLTAPAPALAAKTDERIPTDERELNRFAEHYNTYVELLRWGIIDTKVWRRVRGAWDAMVG